MDVSTRTFDNVVVVAPKGRADLAGSNALEGALSPLWGRADVGGIVLDFSAVPYISSVGLRVLMIALLAAKGIPMLWQGQEFGADNVVPERGFARIGVMRPMPWELFYDDYGQGVLRLLRRERFDIVHMHSPLTAGIARVVARLLFRRRPYHYV